MTNRIAVTVTIVSLAHDYRSGAQIDRLGYDEGYSNPSRWRMEKDPRDIFQKDVRQGLFVWAVLEAVCFWALPLAKVYPYEDVGQMLIPSAVMGPIGAVVVAACSSTMVVAEGIADPKKKKTQITIAQIFSVLGFVALAFPLLLAGVSFARAVSNTNWDELFRNQPTEDKVLE